MSNKWYSKLMKAEGAVDPNVIPDAKVIQTPSPSINWTFGNKGHGLPQGTSLLLGGPAKSGKSFLSLNMVAKLHETDPEAIAVMFNTEFRGELQANKESLKKLGIDPERFVVYDTNEPAGIFDFISHDLKAMCQEGMPLKLIIIDSLSGIQGRRKMNADSVMQQQIGDEAATIQDGLKIILPVIKRQKISLILCTHVRDEMDPHEQMRGNKYRLQAANAAKHMCEFFAFVERNRGKTGKETLDGKALEDESMQDFMGKAGATGHKVRFKMMDTSTGVRDRVAEFTIDFERGIINQYEEVFRLGMNTGIIQKPNNVTYQYKEQSWRGLGAALAAIRDTPDLQKQILKDVYALDIKDSE